MSVYGGEAFCGEMHMKAKRHLAAEMRLKQREEERQNEMNKRIALSLDSTSTKQTTNLASKPLTEKTRKATFELLHHTYPAQTAANDSPSRRPISESAAYESASVQIEASGNAVVQLPLDYRERRERELMFTSAGWKRDCNGGWFRDENVNLLVGNIAKQVEFDSDEEDPNDVFSKGE
ncbi:sodium channel modifier 1-like protein [Tanacetum coccineum]